MRVLFISSGNNDDGINPIVKNQGESLRKLGVDLEYFTIKGKGLRSYLQHVFILKKYLKNHSFDVFHAHYSLSAFTATLAGCSPLIVSLMGSDAFSLFPLNKLIGIFCRFFWKVTIVKTKEMKEHLGLSKCEVLPNGVDLEVFEPIPDKNALRKKMGLKENTKFVLFASNPLRPEKNFHLAQKAIEKMGPRAIELLVTSNVPNSDMSKYYNAADALLLTSLYEGSVNVVKEAMACNLAIVSTDVGDVKENLEFVSGCYICDAEPSALAFSLEKVLDSSNSTNGRENIIRMGLDSKSVAKRLISLYEQVARA